MATNFLWGPVGSVINLLTTELNNLATGAGSAYGPERGGINSPQLGQLHLHLASNSGAFAANSALIVCFVPSIDTASGSAYPTYTSGGSYALALQNYAVATIYINPVTQSANVVDEVVTNVIIPLGFFKTILINQSGVNLPAAGNTLDLFPTPTQY